VGSSSRGGKVIKNHTFNCTQGVKVLYEREKEEVAWFICLCGKDPSEEGGRVPWGNQGGNLFDRNHKKNTHQTNVEKSPNIQDYIRGEEIALDGKQIGQLFLWGMTRRSLCEGNYLHRRQIN